MQVEGQHGLSLLRLMATGARVSNAYPTCLTEGGITRRKDGLIPRGTFSWASIRRNEFRYEMGMRPISLLVR